LNASARLWLLLAMFALVGAMWFFTLASKRMERAAEGVAALPLREFEEPSLIALGSGGTFENHHRRGPALAVALARDVLLIDAGRGVAESLRAAQIPVDQPRTVFLTRLLPENTVGLDDLWLTGALARDGALHVYGPPGTAALVASLGAAHAQDAAAQREAWQLEPAGGELVAHELSGDGTIPVGGLALRYAALADSSLAYRVDAGPTSFAFVLTGVSRERSAALAQGAQVLVAEGLYGASLDAAAQAGADRIDALRREASSHLRLEEVGAVATAAGARAVVLVRLRPPPAFELQYERLVSQTFRGPVIVAEDAEVVTP
jgi:ribonuclease BN (tRNA processing enzyme)